MTFMKRVPKTLMFLVLLLPFFTNVSAAESYFVNIVVGERANTYIPWHDFGSTGFPQARSNLLREIKELNLDYTNKQVFLYYLPSTSAYYLYVSDNYVSNASASYLLTSTGSPNNNIKSVGMPVHGFNSNGIYTGVGYTDHSNLTNAYRLVHINALMKFPTREELGRNVCSQWVFSNTSNAYNCTNWALIDHAYITTYSYLKQSYDNDFISLFEGNSVASQLIDVNTGLDNVNQGLDNVDQSIKDMDNTIKDSDVGGATTDADDFFGGFDTDFGGLTSIVTAPLVLIQSMTSSCNDLNLPLGIVSGSLTLPCMSTIYTQYFGNFFTIYRTITDGMIAYGVVRSLFSLVQGFKNPEDSKIEVVDL